jgi:3-oxoacyl-[acyl-carrier-protein] synthase III
MINTKILGTGSYVPKKMYTNGYIQELELKKDIWLQMNLR